jgi:hypothetical protein
MSPMITLLWLVVSPLLTLGVKDTKVHDDPALSEIAKWMSYLAQAAMAFAPGASPRGVN